MTDAMPTVHLFTDGACSGNPGPGGWGLILRHPATGKEIERSGAEANTTNNRMELMAVIEGLRLLTKPTIVDELAQKHDVRMHWIRGHQGHPENERADSLAVKAREDLVRSQ